MESAVLSSKKETLVAFRIAAKDVEDFKKMAEDHYRRGDIKTPTVAALGKWNLYWTCNMLKDLEKARILADEQQRRRQQQFENSHQAIEVEKPKVDQYRRRYRDYSYPSSQLQPPRVPYPNDMSLQNQEAEDGRDDYNYNFNGKSITRPFFYELFPDWQSKNNFQTRSRQS
jgi:hypothetical protein